MNLDLEGRDGLRKNKKKTPPKTWRSNRDAKRSCDHKVGHGGQNEELRGVFLTSVKIPFRKSFGG